MTRSPSRSLQRRISNRTGHYRLEVAIRRYVWRQPAVRTCAARWGVTTRWQLRAARNAWTATTMKSGQAEAVRRGLLSLVQKVCSRAHYAASGPQSV
jgi:hypothetical protein